MRDTPHNADVVIVGLSPRERLHGGNGPASRSGLGRSEVPDEKIPWVQLSPPVPAVKAGR